eukprot:scaffold152918_cov49-Prasinocladus_malaysianus.AAC.1
MRTGGCHMYVEMAWLLRYLSTPNPKISVSEHRKSEIARHAADGLPAMDAHATYMIVSSSLDMPRSHQTFAAY